MPIQAHERMTEVTDATFADEVLHSDQPVLVDYWATWCGPCRMVSPVLAELAEEHADRWRVVELEVDANQVTAIGQRVLGVPTMILYKGGRPVASVVGARSKRALWAAFEPYL